MTGVEIIKRAAELVGGPRAAAYGDWNSNYSNVVILWNAYLQIRLRRMTDQLDAHDAALMMVLLKIARTVQGPHKVDNYIDIAGYGGGAGEIAEFLDGLTRGNDSSSKQEHSAAVKPGGYDPEAQLEDIYSGRGPR